MTFAVQVETSLPRAGRRFEPVRELKLHADALLAAESLSGVSRGLVIVPEFSGPIGIPDFTAYVGDVQALRARQRASIPPLVNEIDAGVVSVAYVRRPRSAEGLAEAIGWPRATVAGRLRRLVGSGALREIGDGRYVRAPEAQPSGRLYAIETKVGDTRAALLQARTYRVWADGYVIVMSDVSERALEKLRDDVLSDGGGLVVDGRWIARARVGRVPAARRLQAAEMFASATRGGL